MRINEQKVIPLNSIIQNSLYKVCTHSNLDEDIAKKAFLGLLNIIENEKEQNLINSLFQTIAIQTTHTINNFSFILSLIEDKKIIKNIVNDYGDDLMMAAVRVENIKIINLLLEVGLDFKHINGKEAKNNGMATFQEIILFNDNIDIYNIVIKEEPDFFKNCIYTLIDFPYSKITKNILQQNNYNYLGVIQEPNQRLARFITSYEDINNLTTNIDIIYPYIKDLYLKNLHQNNLAHLLIQSLFNYEFSYKNQDIVLHILNSLKRDLLILYEKYNLNIFESNSQGKTSISLLDELFEEKIKPLNSKVYVACYLEILLDINKPNEENIHYYI